MLPGDDGGDRLVVVAVKRYITVDKVRAMVISHQVVVEVNGGHSDVRCDAADATKQPGIAIGRLCEKCDGKCVICDSYVRPCTLVRVCDECNYGSFQGRCVICGGVGISDAYYCKECTQQEKDRDGCPKIVNLGSAKTDLFYELFIMLELGLSLLPTLSIRISAVEHKMKVMSKNRGAALGLACLIMEHEYITTEISLVTFGANMEVVNNCA
ncbi:hypothetical protein JRO89_XS13G0097000 [Xanthoceras sorbifolium]|uniref:PHD finger-like domain-containing protein 5A n=1 Tax=Xanthoceras sorbifolium TaxID=99658 RepID=A0ABQ8H7J1_9ROSI|nr:hypothetical protein JRO89_XS13G0097000 [Xanthoceras sorbifolium]